MKGCRKKFVKVAICGAGEVAKTSHLPAYRKIKCSKVVALCDINKETAEKTSRLLNVPRYYTSLEACLDEEAPDLVDICAPPNSHFSLASLALKAGSHVIVEKPLIVNLSEYEQVEKLHSKYKSKGLLIGVIHNWLFEFFTPIICSVVERGEIGEILHANVSIFARQDDPMILDPNHWCHSITGGRLGECLVHPVYILQRYIGTLEVTQVHVSKQGPHPYVAFDELFATLRSSDGKLGTIYITFNSPRADFPVISLYGSKKHLLYHNSNLVTLGALGYSQGSETSAIQKGLDNLRQILHISKSLCRHTARRIFRTRRSGHEVFIANFINSIIEENEPVYSFEEALQATKTFLEILKRLPIRNTKIS